MIRKTIAAALTVAVLGASAMMATTVSSEAGFHGGGHHHGHHNKHRHFGHGYGYGYGYCFWKRIKVWDYYGFHWEKVRICG